MKKGDMKRTQILDAAERLFLGRGYERTSVQDVLDALGMSKGGFYHYFESKESVLRAVSERRTAARVERALSDVRDGRRSPLERLNLLLVQASLFETEEPGFAGTLMRLACVERDYSLAAQRRRILIDLLLPALDEVLEAGIADGSFFMRRPAEAGRLLLLLALDADDEVCALLAGDPENPDRLIPAIELLNACREAAELLVGAPHGALELKDVGRLVANCRAAAAAMQAREGA